MNAMQIQTRPRVLALLMLPLIVATAALLSACGDGGGVENGGNNNSGETIPVGSVDDFSKWVATRTPDDAGEPLVVDGLSPPTSDTVEPMVL